MPDDLFLCPAKSGQAKYGIQGRKRVSGDVGLTMLGWGGGRNRHAGFGIRFGQLPHIRFQSRFEQTSFKSRRKRGFACVTGFRYDARAEGSIGLPRLVPYLFAALDAEIQL
jgi:hypothetical protein